MRRPLKVQCTAETKSGQRCRKYCKSGEYLCAEHAATLPPAAELRKDELAALLQRLTRDRDPGIRLRAIEAVLKWQEREAARSMESSGTSYDKLLTYATPAQLATLREHVAAIAATKQQILDYIAAGGAPIERPDPTAGAGRSRNWVPPADARPTPAPAAPQEVDDAPPAPTLLDRSLWPSVGLYETTTPEGRRVVTHANGDEHAKDILEGRISLADAQAAEQQRERQLRIITGSAREGKLTWGN